MRPRRRVLAAAIAALVVVAGSVARPPLARSETLTWAQAKQRAAARSPGALQARQTVRAAEAEAEGAGRWPRDNPVISGSFETGAVFGNAADRTWTVGIEQELDVTGVAAAGARAARGGVGVAGGEAGVLRLDALGEAADAFFELDRAQRALAIWTELDESFRAISAATARATLAGERSRLDAILAEADSAGATTELAQAKGDLARAQARLGVIVGSSDPAALRVEAPEAVPPPDARTSARLAAEAVRRRPELALWRARIGEAQARGSFAARSALPRPTIGVSFKREQGEEGRDAFLGDPGGLLGYRKAESLLEVTLAVPITIFDRNQAERARAAADESSAREQLELAAREARAAAVQARARVDAAWAAFERWQALQPRLREAQELLERGYAAGEASLFDTLVSAERVARARARALDARADYLKARAELARALGEEP